METIRHSAGHAGGTELDGGLAEKRALIVDDEKGILVSFRELLRKPGLEVDTAQNAGDAVLLLKERHYDVVISDIRLNDVMGVDGLKLLRYVKENLPDTHVIMVTGYGTPDSIEKAFELGATFYFEKPISIIALQKALFSLGLGK